MADRPAVLVADDEKVCLLVASKLLEHLGMQAILANNGVEAVKLYEEHRDRIVCVLLDIHMPKMNGIEAFARLREIDSEVNVIMVSGYINDASMALLEPHNPLGYIEKPLDLARLSNQLQKLAAI